MTPQPTTALARFKSWRSQLPLSGLWCRTDPRVECTGGSPCRLRCRPATAGWPAQFRDTVVPDLEYYALRDRWRQTAAPQGAVVGARGGDPAGPRR